jgi:hypothetical protein
LIRFSSSHEVTQLRARLHNLLWLEEAQGVVNMCKYDLLAVILEPMEDKDEANPSCKLMVPGLLLLRIRQIRVSSFASRLWWGQALRKGGLRS